MPALIALLAGYLILLTSCAATEPTFVFRNRFKPSNEVTVRITRGDARIFANRAVWSVDKPVSVAWVGFSNDGERFTVLTCASNEDYFHAIERFEFPPSREWPTLPSSFADSDKNLVDSLRSSFGLSHRTDRQVIHWFCEGSGEQELRLRSAWPKRNSDIVALPDQLLVKPK